VKQGAPELAPAAGPGGPPRAPGPAQGVCGGGLNASRSRSPRGPEAVLHLPDAPAQGRARGNPAPATPNQDIAMATKENRRAQRHTCLMRRYVEKRLRAGFLDFMRPISCGAAPGLPSKVSSKAASHGPPPRQ